MRELKIEPQFRDLIPKLTDEEFKQLEKNILEDGKVNQPIVVWNDVIVDGHHRYYVVQKHPEIPFEVEEKDFPNEYAAMAWACANQLGRRNLSDKDRSYLIGKQYLEEKLAVGENQYTKRVAQTGLPTEKRGNTRERIAKENNVGHATVERAEQFAKGVDIADEIIPGTKEKILHDDKVDISKTLVRGLTKAEPETQKEIVQAMSDAKDNSDLQNIRDIYHKTGTHYEDVRYPISHKNDTPSLSAKEESEPYNADDMLEEIRCAKDSLDTVLRQTMMVLHNDILNTKEGREKALTGLNEIQETTKKYINLITTKEENNGTRKKVLSD